ncbi:MAG: NUDIX domain-containing protein [Synechococcales cyanobacterium T60_A2020_003]|nr:NUDIX domain-containing protein [Synechococcales cyanobacterium T60_A2020_003]
MSQEPIQVAIAILHQDNQFLMQLRDNIPTILYPGVWAFFGGHLDPGERPGEGVIRELTEEIGYRPPTMGLFRVYKDAQIIRHVFHGPLTVPIYALELNEGWDLGLLSVADIHRGDRYSERAGDIRPLGAIHRQILLDFLDQHSPIARVSDD